MARAPIKFYYDLMSQPSRAVYMFLRLANIPFDDNQIALRKAIHLTDEYRDSVNPFKTVPAIVDNDFKLAESVAIFRYLTRRNKIDDHWYPKDDQARARIDEYLEWQHLNTRQTCFQYFILTYLKPRKMGSSPDDAQVNAAAQRQMGEVLDKIENIWLKDGAFIGGQKDISFADILAACEIEQPRISGYEPGDGRPKLRAWHNLVKERTNPIYDEAHAIAYKFASQQ